MTKKKFQVIILRYLKENMRTTWKSSKNLILDLILVCLAQIWAPFFCFFVFWVLVLIVVGHCSKLSFYAIYMKTNKLINQIEKIAKNLILGLICPVLAQFWSPNFLKWVLPLLDVTHSCKL